MAPRWIYLRTRSFTSRERRICASSSSASSASCSACAPCRRGRLSSTRNRRDEDVHVGSVLGGKRDERCSLFGGGGKEERGRKSRGTRSRTNAFRAVDALVQNINNIIGTAAGDTEPVDVALEGEEDSVKLLDTTDYKNVAIRIKLRDRVLIADEVAFQDKFEDLCRDSPGKVSDLLQRYLGLPFEQYSVLNPEWIERLEEEEEGTFLLSIPLNDIVGLELQPSLKTQVKTTSGNGNGKGGTVAAGNGEGGAQRERETRLGRLPSNRKQQPPSNEVTIDGKEAKMGSSIFDDLVDVSFVLNVAEGRSKNRGLGKRVEKSNGEGLQVSPMETNRKTVLRGSLLLEIDVSVPMPLSKLPRRVLKSAGGTLIRLVVQRMLKGFLVLLAKDFEGWCYGDNRDSIGSTKS